MSAKQSNSAGFRNRVNFDFQFLHIARYSLRWITIDLLVNTLNVLLLGRVPSLTLGYGTLRILPKPRQSTDFFFILKKIINIRGFKCFIPFFKKRKKLIGPPDISLGHPTLKLYWTKSAKLGQHKRVYRNRDFLCTKFFFYSIFFYFASSI